MPDFPTASRLDVSRTTPADTSIVVDDVHGDGAEAAGAASLFGPSEGRLEGLPRVHRGARSEPPENDVSALFLETPVVASDPHVRRAGEGRAVSVVPFAVMSAAAPLIVPSSEFHVSGNHDPGLAATQASCSAVGSRGDAYRLKQNPPERAANTFHEVMSARVLDALGLPYSPITSWVSDEQRPDRNAVWIASPLIAGSKDLGPFLVENGGAHVEPENAGAYASALAAYHSAAARAAVERSRPAVQALLKRYPKGGFEHLTSDEHRSLQALRKAELDALTQQDRLLDLLPASFRSELRRAFYASEVVGQWDFLNHLRYNTVLRFAPDGRTPQAYTVDLGVTGLMGFGGRMKSDSLASANVPARIDDPYAKQPPDGGADSGYPNTYPAGNLLPVDTDFRRVSGTFGLIGSTPRSPVVAALQRSTVRNESEWAGERHHAAPIAPPEAMEVAWHLGHVPRGKIRDTITAAFAEGEAHPDPAIRRLFAPAISGVPNADVLADLYEARVQAIVLRAQRNDELNRWATANPERATLIRASALDGRQFPR